MLIIFVSGYEHMRGLVLDANELKSLFQGLKLNGLHHFSHLLTGAGAHCMPFLCTSCYLVYVVCLLFGSVFQA